MTKVEELKVRLFKDIRHEIVMENWIMVKAYYKLLEKVKELNSQ